MDVSTNGRMRSDPDAFDIAGPVRRLRSILGHHKLLIAATCLATLALVVAYIVIRPAVYKAEVKVYSEPTSDAQRDKFYDRWNVFRKDDVASEPELLLQGSVLARTIQELDLGYDDVYHPLGSQLAQWWRTNPVGIEYRALKHRFFPPKPSKWDPTPEQEALARTFHDFQTSVSFTQVAKTHVGKIEVIGPTPRVAEIANKLVDVYEEERANRHHEEAKRAYDALKAHTDEAYAALQQMERRLQDLRENDHVYLDFVKEKATIQQWTEMRVKIVELQASISHAKEELAEIEKELAKEDPEVIGARNYELNAVRRTMEAKLVDHELTLRALLNRYKPDSPEVTDETAIIEEIKRKIADAKEMILSSESSQRNALRETLRGRRAALLASLAGSKAQLEVIQSGADRMHQEIDALPEKQRRLASLTRDRDIAETKYRVFLDKQMQAEASMLAALDVTPSLQVLDRATPPLTPIWPNTKLLLAAGFAVGLLLGVMLATLKDMVDSRVRTRFIREGRIPVPVYATIDVGAGVPRNGRGPGRPVKPRQTSSTSGPRA